MNDIELMTCDWCGKQFPADARACLESGISAFHPAEEGDEWKGDEPIELDPSEFSPEQREEIKSGLQINDAQLDELLRTGSIEKMGAIVCLECQEKGSETP